MKKILIMLILLMFTVPAYATTVYKWVDEKGVINFTDDYTKIPPAFRKRAKVEEYVQQEGTTAPAQGMVATATEQIRTDIYGRGETWWREKVRPWKEQLKEATENYERVREEYMKQAEGLGPYNFGEMSLTQYQMLSSRLNILNNDMGKYRAQMLEANEMLEKLSKEAEETKADPAWFE
ncbi:MAG: DUF4124 domain-containing protein [Syntrophales bacterium]